MDSDQHADAQHDANPVFDPESIPNVALHRGDVLVVDPFSHGRYEYRLFDAYQRHLATLVGDHNSDGHFVIDTIQHIGRGRELLPLRRQPQPDAYTQPLTVANAYAATITVSVPLPSDGPYEYRLAHHHSHAHAGDADGALPHAHDHAHSGADAHRAGQYGHGRDPHAHRH